jgi:hypothetical protein
VAACNGSRSEANDVEITATVATKPNLDQVEQALANIVATAAETGGTVEVRRKGSATWEKLAVGATLRERDWVRTSDASFARLRFAAGGFVDMRAATTIIVDSAIGIEAGEIVGVAEGKTPILVKAADGSTAKIVAGEAASEVRLTPSANQGLEIAVTKGKVSVITDAGEQAVERGEASDLRGKKTGEIVKLLGYPASVSPGVDARFLFVKEKATALAWGNVKDAAKYRVQVARDTDFRELVLNVETDKAGAAFVADRVGTYAWHAAAVDADGRVGEFGFARRIFFEEVAPHDLLLAPHDGVKIGFADKPPRVGFAWQSAGDIKNYKLVIWRGNERLTTIPATRQTAETTLGEGIYRWGVYAVRGTEEAPIFMAPRAIVIRKQRVKVNTDKLWEK